jgi:hypothetical protein
LTEVLCEHHILCQVILRFVYCLTHSGVLTNSGVGDLYSEMELLDKMPPDVRNGIARNVSGGILVFVETPETMFLVCLFKNRRQRVVLTRVRKMLLALCVCVRARARVCLRAGQAKKSVFLLRGLDDETAGHIFLRLKVPFPHPERDSLDEETKEGDFRRRKKRGRL